MPDSALAAALVRRSLTTASSLAQAYLETVMLSTVRITRTTGKPGFDRSTGQPTAASTDVIYEGKAHVYDVTGGAAYELGEEQQTASQTYVAIPLSAARPQVKDEVAVLDDPNDPELIDRHFKVDDVRVGGLIPGSRRMAVTGIEPAPNTVAP